MEYRWLKHTGRLQYGSTPQRETFGLIYERIQRVPRLYKLLIVQGASASAKDTNSTCKTLRFIPGDRKIYLVQRIILLLYMMHMKSYRQHVCVRLIS